MHFKSEQHLLLVGQVADDAPERKRQRLDEGWGCQNALVFGHFRVFEHIDDLEVVAALELLLADLLEICDGTARSRARARYEKSKQILGQDASPTLGALNANRHSSGGAAPEKDPFRPVGCIT